MTQFLLRGLTLLVLTSVAPAGSLGGVDGAARRVGAAQAARVGREFKLRAGRAVTFEGGNLRLKFASVAEDSRCPVGVNCIWAGNAEVLVEVAAKGGRGKKTLTLNTSDRQHSEGEGKYGRYTVKLLGLSPQPRKDKMIEASEYTATLLVVKE